MSTKTTDRTTAEIASLLLTVVRVMNQVRVHEALCRQAGVDLDRSGSAVLFKLYADGDDIRLTDLAERLGVDPPAVTRKVQQLERIGFISRSADPNDARASRLKLTTSGTNAIAHLLAVREEWLGELLEGWPKSDRKELARLLQLFATTVAHDVEARHGH